MFSKSTEPILLLSALLILILLLVVFMNEVSTVVGANLTKKLGAAARIAYILILKNKALNRSYINRGLLFVVKFFCITLPETNFYNDEKSFCCGGGPAYSASLPKK
jgi:uncharacterized membrane protein